jgi:hypothetical protein
MLVIPVNRVVDKKRIIGKKWRAQKNKYEPPNCNRRLQCLSPVLKKFELLCSLL